MITRPILFNSAMVRAILSGSKTQTRRRIKLSPTNLEHLLSIKNKDVCCPLGQPGHRLWVRESFQRAGGNTGWWYRATDGAADNGHSPVSRWIPSIHMPRQASRITLEITSVRVEQLQAISAGDAKAEGVEEFGLWLNHRGIPACKDHIDTFRHLWEFIYTPSEWDLNPWVWVVEFKRFEVSA